MQARVFKLTTTGVDSFCWSFSEDVGEDVKTQPDIREDHESTVCKADSVANTFLQMS